MSVPGRYDTCSAGGSAGGPRGTAGLDWAPPPLSWSLVVREQRFYVRETHSRPAAG